MTSGIYKGNSGITKIYKGNSPISKVYKGTSLINFNNKPSVFYEISTILENLKLTNTAVSVAENSQYNTDLTNTYFKATTIDGMMVIMGEEDITNSSYYENSKYINIPSVTGNIQIIAKGSTNSTKTQLYYIKSIVSNCNYTGEDYWINPSTGTNYFSCTLIANSGSFNKLKITMGGVDITESAYSGDSIFISGITGNILIIAEG